MRTHTIVLTLATAALALTACTSSPHNPAPQPPATKAAPGSPAPDPSRAELEEAVRAFSTAYLKPDPDAGYAMLSERCRRTIGKSVWAGLAKSAAKDYGRRPIKTLTVLQLAGDDARVSYTYGLPRLDQLEQPWLRENGSWRYDAC
ncbi:hypothetical protein [Peterkaempfera sp. SMS 1(5)a]|uniref:hypothetical protein n=1 Tax=Peterkaempfera podocarpi TaxID=3232308 RepID=UPI00366E75A7